MKVVSFIDAPQEGVIQKILKHCDLWEEPPEKAPPDLDGFTKDPDEVVEIEYVNIDTFLAACPVRSPKGEGGSSD